MTPPRRGSWAGLSDADLLAQCHVDTYRASGPGGQKRNKTSSAVRLRHAPSGLSVIAEESRSQHENRARALRRLRQTIFLKIREELTAGADPLGAAHGQVQLRAPNGRLTLSRKDARFWPAVGIVLDVLVAAHARMRDAAVVLGISTANLVDFLRIDSKAWEQANQLRARFGHKPLRA